MLNTCTVWCTTAAATAATAAGAPITDADAVAVAERIKPKS